MYSFICKMSITIYVNYEPSCYLSLLLLSDLLLAQKAAIWC